MNIKKLEEVIFRKNALPELIFLILSEFSLILAALFVSQNISNFWPVKNIVALFYGLSIFLGFSIFMRWFAKAFQ